MQTLAPPTTPNRWTSADGLKRVGAFLLAVFVAATVAQAQDFDQPPINYSSGTPDNAVSRLDARLASGAATLSYEAGFGYLRSLLGELKLPQSSQMLVFSKTSLQRHRISPQAPRSIYFNDDVYVGFCQGGEVLEV